jgi:hypothetical protein
VSIELVVAVVNDSFHFISADAASVI